MRPSTGSLNEAFHNHFFIFSSFCFANQKNDSFSTRLHDRLAIAAIKCQENETTASIDQEMWVDYTCADDEWLMVVDNLNRYDDNISCTDIPVMPKSGGFSEDIGFVLI